ncbi:hypothetical protein HL13_gp70 [Dinoroseobacter phage DFL12phi1]|uniref:Uncharacterized protein n=1 Tax=Dinoroseobacter phage DFL12phi1 TaxID=1477404 RepID=A0A023NHD5_9CAUD|nr:hypothetical protein HL13_gp70 [Dinoroseobacter phage DFL12phi1]AHX01030.1 hypothetical protein DFL12P1_0070 [Dinoroseobacter phage DFL12phi1]
MITGEDIDRCKDEKQGVKLVVVDTMQFFEFEIPEGMDPEEFVNSAECRAECAALILNQTTDLTIDRVCTQYDEVNEQWLDP